MRLGRDWCKQRLSAGQTVLLVDAAPPPVAHLAVAGCASTNAMEISDGPYRLVVNCGGAALAGATIPEDLAQGLRTTAAHSTLVLDDRNSTAILNDGTLGRSEENTSELQSLMRLSYAVFCLKKKTTN